MHMMFVDESGDPGYPKKGDWKTFGGSKIYTRVGLIIHGWRWKSWNQKIVELKKQRGLLWDSEIRGSDLARGKRAFAGWDEARRERFSIDLATLIGRNADFSLLGVVIDKSNVDTKQREELVKPQIRSLELLLERFNFFLHHQKDKAGIVVLDPTKEQQDDQLRHFQGFLQSSSLHLDPLHIVEGTFFAKSHTSNMIQLSDFCCNVFYKEMNKEPELPSRPEWKEICHRFWKLNGRIKGVSIKRWPEKPIVR